MNRFLAVLLLMIPVILIAQPAPDTLWTRTFGGAGDDSVSVMRRTCDGGFVIAGYTTSFGAGGKDMYVVKTDSLGNLEWQHTYGGSGDDVVTDIHQLADGGYVIGGNSNSDTSIIKWVAIRIDSVGDSLWVYALQWFGGAETVGQRTGIIPFADGYYLIAKVDRSSSTWFGGCMVTLNPDGIPTDTSLLGNCAVGVHFWLGDVEVFADGTALFAYTLSCWVQNNPNDPWNEIYEDLFAKVDASGVFCCTGGTELSNPLSIYGVARTEDGDYIALSERPAIYRLDTLAQVERQYDLQLSSLADIRPGLQDGFVVLRSSNSIELYGFDSSGTQRWNRNYGSSGVSYAAALESTPDGGYAIAGTVTSFGAGDMDMYLVKTGPDHPLGTEAAAATLPTSFVLSTYPNPFNPATTLSFTLPKAGRTRVTVYDLQGREVKVLADGMMRAGEQKMTFDGSELPSGIYFAQVEAGEMVMTQKMMLLK
jgi:hypothetical protein